MCKHLEKLKELNRWCLGSLRLTSYSALWELSSYDPAAPLYHVVFTGEDLKEIIDKAYDFVVNRNNLVINTNKKESNNEV